MPIDVDKAIDGVLGEISDLVIEVKLSGDRLSHKRVTIPDSIAVAIVPPSAPASLYDWLAWSVRMVPVGGDKSGAWMAKLSLFIHKDELLEVFARRFGLPSPRAK